LIEFFFFFSNIPLFNIFTSIHWGAGLANKFNIKKEMVRGVVVIGAIVSSSALIIPYLCGILLKEESTI
tara:strand:+ start:62 stop:268 length:207 start_codon:yes stop_codon:yes gene_type:complete